MQLASSTNPIKAPHLIGLILQILTLKEHLRLLESDTFLNFFSVDVI